MSNVITWPIIPKSIPKQSDNADIAARAKRLRQGLDFLAIENGNRERFDAQVKLALIESGYAKTLDMLREWVQHLENVVEKDGT
jgi:hypothetical protein